MEFPETKGCFPCEKNIYMVQLVKVSLVFANFLVILPNKIEERAKRDKKSRMVLEGGLA